MTRWGVSHGMSRRPEWRAWEGMRRRCSNPNDQRFKHYGGRGIVVCERWRVFENFYADMGERPSPKHTLERLDNNGNYEPGNCRWATKKEQARNRSTTLLVTINGEAKALAEWCEIYGIPHARAWQRINAGWSAIEALTLPAVPKSVGVKGRKAFRHDDRAA